MKLKNLADSPISYGSFIVDVGDTDAITMELKSQLNNHAYIADDLVNEVCQILDDDDNALSTNDALNYLKDNLNPSVSVKEQPPFCSTDNFHFRGTGISGTADNGTTTNIDYKLTEERYINGIRLVLNEHVFGDSLCFQVVDVDNILGYGAGTVLDEFGKDWYVNPDMACQGDILISYPAKVYQGLYIRLVYDSTGTEDVGVKANLYLHRKVT